MRSYLCAPDKVYSVYDRGRRLGDRCAEKVDASLFWRLSRKAVALIPTTATSNSERSSLPLREAYEVSSGGRVWHPRERASALSLRIAASKSYEARANAS